MSREFAIGSTFVSSGEDRDYMLPVTYLARPAVVAGRVKVWSGSAFVQKPAKVWDGSSWATKPVKVWNGSAWV